ncbi:MAG TPA: histidine kinase [Stackebrandtia sp.]|uniref:sensor histidine kinase n=1 Tax=Stackebrandtia sp. TaxID=2023065 RepID=UPI002D2C7759|nr:histidine kinase [Stackebrandtia sp.]HZE42024.1 histidine kinase [Stackebrandtia sp.]
MRLVVAPERGERGGYAPRLTAAGRGWLMVVSAAAVAPGVLAVGARGLSTAVGLVVALGLVVVQTGAMWWMDARPVAVTVVAIGLGAGVQTLMFPGSGAGTALIAVCCFAWLRPARVSLWVLGGVVVLSGAIRWGRWDAAAAWAVAAALAWSVGALGRARAVQRRAEASRAVAEERARIAGEIHDILSHGIAVMMVNATVAEDAFASDVDRARLSIREVAEQGRRALGEVRGVLRALDGYDAVAVVSGLSALDRVAESMGVAGLDVALRVSGLDGVEVPRDVDLAAFRVVQESLTNTLRHSRSKRAEVSVSVADGRLRVRVRDEGPARTDGQRTLPSGSGRGIVGMRRRVERLGGTMSAEAEPTGGFAVMAAFPLEGNR